MPAPPNAFGGGSGAESLDSSARATLSPSRNFSRGLYGVSDIDSDEFTRLAARATAPRGSERSEPTRRAPAGGDLPADATPLGRQLLPCAREPRCQAGGGTHSTRPGIGMSPGTSEDVPP